MLMEISWNSTRAKSCICSGITPHNTNRPMLTLRDSFAEKDPGSQWTTWWLGDSRCPCSKEIWPCSGLLRVKPEREWSFASLWHLMDYTWMKYCTQFWVHLDKDAGILEEQTHQDWNPCTLRPDHRTHKERQGNLGLDLRETLKTLLLPVTAWSENSQKAGMDSSQKHMTTGWEATDKLEDAKFQLQIKGFF